MTGKDVLLLQQAVDDTQVHDLGSFTIRIENFVTAAALITLFVNERSQLSSVMHMTVMSVQTGPIFKPFLPLTETATKVRDSPGFVRFAGFS